MAALHAVKIRDVAAGASFSVCLALDGSVFTFGEGLSGQLGLGGAVTCSAQPQRVLFDVTAALTDAEGAVRRSKRSAGAGPAAGSSSSFAAAAAASLSAASARSERSAVSVSIVDISAGAAHVLARSASGHVFTWGLGSKGQLGLGDLQPRQAPVLVRLRPERPIGNARGRLLVASCISAGRFHSAALTGASEAAGKSSSGGSAGASSGSVVFVWGAAHLGPSASRASAAVRPCSAARPCSPLRSPRSGSTDAASKAGSASSTPIVQRWPLPTGIGPLAAVPRERRRRGSASSASAHSAPASSPGRSPSPAFGRGGGGGAGAAGELQSQSQSASPTTEGVARGAAALAAGAAADAGFGAAHAHAEDAEAASIDAVAAGTGAAQPRGTHHGSAAGAGAAAAAAAGGAHGPGISIAADGNGNGDAAGEDKAARRARVEAGTFQVPLARTRAHASLRLREREYAVRKAALDAAAAAAASASAGAASSESSSARLGASPVDGGGGFIVPLQSARSASLTAAGEGHRPHHHDGEDGHDGAPSGVAAVATGGTAGAMTALHISPGELLAAADAEAAAARGRRPAPFGSQHAAAAGLVPTGDLNATVLHRIAASAGVRLRDAPAVAGAPWCRQPRPAADPKVEGEVLLFPTPLDAPFLRGSARAAAVACGHGYTAVFLPAQVASVDPAVTLDTGGRLLTLQGQALGSVCRLGHAYRDAASLGSFGASIAARNPNAELLAQAGHAHPDATGMVPIPGVLVRFALTDKQPGRREDDPPDYDPDADSDDDDDDDDNDDDGGRDGAGSAGGSAGARAREAQRRVWYARAYFPPGWATEPTRDVPGLANDEYSVSAGAAGFHGAADGGHAGAVGGGVRSRGEPLSLDCLVAVAPAVPRPCKVKVSVLLKPPRPWLSALSDTAAALPVPIGVGAVPLELDVIASGAAGGGRSDPHDLTAGGFGYGTQQHGGGGAGATSPLARPPTMRRRGQVLHGAPTLDFLTLPIVNEAQPPLLRLPEPAAAASVEAQGGSVSARSGAAAPGVAEGGASAGTGAVAAPPEDAPVVTLAGEHLFGAALVDPLAAPVAEHLIDLVKAAVRAREREEAYLLVSEAGLPPLPLPNREDAGATVPARLGRGGVGGEGREGKGGDEDDDEGFGGVDGSDDEDNGVRGGGGGAGSRRFAGLRSEGGRAGERKAGDYADDDEGAEDEDEAREQGEKIDLLLPTLHLQRGTGDAAHPDGVLVRFAVYSAPAPAASRGGGARGRSRSPGTARSGASAGSGGSASAGDAASAGTSSSAALSPIDSLSPLAAPQPPSASDAGIIAAPTSPKPKADPTLGAKLLGHSAPARGWFSLHYDEHLLHVGAAVDKMTGTTKAAAKIAAAPTAGGSSVFASGSSVFNSGSSVFAGGSKFAGSVFSTAASGASAFGGGGGGGAGAGRSTHSGGGASAYDAGDDEDDEEDAEDDEGVIGRYSATISVRLPDVASVLARAHGGAGGSSSSAAGGGAGAGLPAVPDAIWSAFKALLAGSMKSGAAGSSWLAAAAASALRLDGASAAAAAAFSWEREFEAAVAKRRSAGGGLLLRPEISVNGGKDFIAGAPASVITAINPSVSHVAPPVGPGAGGFDLVIRGTGLVDAPNLLVRFTPLLPPSASVADEHAAAEAAAAAAEAAITVKAAFIDATAVRCVVPELPRIAADGSLLTAAGDVAPGYGSYSVQLSSDGGRTFSGGPRMRLVGWWGAAAPAGPIPGSAVGAGAGTLPLLLVPMGGRTIKLPLAPRSAAAGATATSASFDAWCDGDNAPAGAAAGGGAAGGPGSSPLRSRMSSLASDGTGPGGAIGGAAAGGAGGPGSVPSISPPSSPRAGAAGGSGASVASMASASGPAGSASQLSLALRGSWVPPIALVGHPIHGLGCRTVLHVWQVGASAEAIAASTLPAPAGKSTVARVAALGAVVQLKPEGARWAAAPAPALPAEGEADALSVAIPALSSVLPAAASGADGAAAAAAGGGTGAASPAPAPGAGTPGAARGGSASVASLPVPAAGPPPELRHAVAELHLWGRPVPASRLRIRYYGASSSLTRDSLAA